MLVVARGGTSNKPPSSNSLYEYRVRNVASRLYCEIKCKDLKERFIIMTE